MRAWTLSLDIAAVALFVALGRDTHGRDATLTGFLETAAPFLIALVVGWFIAKAWRAPVSAATGIRVVAATVVVGMLLRRLIFGNGIAPSFIIVTTLFLALFLLGWRVVAVAVKRRFRAATTAG
jgi:hypothetical protein